MADLSSNEFLRSCPPRIQPLGDGLRLAAPAKINLDLLIGPLRPDGFHPLDSLVAKVSLCDRLDLTLRDDGQITFHCEGVDCGPDEDNLVLQAAKMLAPDDGRRGADITLGKTIPVGMGLGGGSSDAAAALVGLDRLWGLNLTRDQFAAAALALGSDVPLFFGPPAARMTGRGEHLEPVEVHPLTAVLVLPPFGCPTGKVYGAFDELPPPQPDRRLDLSELREPPSQWRSKLANDLAKAAMKVQPRLAEVYARLVEAVTQPVSVTGSGSAMFVLCDDVAEAAAVVEQLPADIRPFGRIVTNCPW